MRRGVHVQQVVQHERLAGRLRGQSARNVELIGKMINTSLSCVPPIVQLAGKAALKNDAAERDATMAKFQKKVELLVSELRKVDGVTVLMPAGTFYVFPNVSRDLPAARDHVARAGDVPARRGGRQEGGGVPGRRVLRRGGQGFLRFSCAEPDERLVEAVRFFADAVTRTDRVQAYLEANPKYRQSLKAQLRATPPSAARTPSSPPSAAAC